MQVNVDQSADSDAGDEPEKSARPTPLPPPPQALADGARVRRPAKRTWGAATGRLEHRLNPAAPAQQEGVQGSAARAWTLLTQGACSSGPSADQCDRR